MSQAADAAAAASAAQSNKRARTELGDDESSSSLPVTTTLLQTLVFAAHKHRNQRRKDAEKMPYINHPIGVAEILATFGGVTDVQVLQAAVLHDTVEDTDTSFEELEERFGTAVTNIVREVSDDKNLNKVERKRQQIEHAPHKSPQAKLVSLGDKIHNLRGLTESTVPEGWGVDRVQRYFAWAYRVVRGYRGTNAGLEAVLDDLFARTFELGGEKHSVLPDDIENAPLV